MDFFEVLRERAKLPEFNPPFMPYSPLETLAFHRGRNATIEALKEMVVEESITGSLRHVLNPPDAPHTMLDNSAVKDPAYGEALFERHIGTDGEEVVVMVFRDEKDEAK